MIEPIFRYGIDVLEYLRNGSYSYRELGHLKRLQFMSIDDLTKYRDSKIRNIVRHAYDNVEFYRKLYRDKGDIGEIKGTRDLERLPIVTKKQLRENFPNRVVAPDLMNRAYYDKTSGSTGEPFQFYKDMKYNALRLSSYMLFNTWMGIGVNDRHIQIASPKTLTLATRIRNWIFRKHKISTLLVKKENMRSLVKKIEGINPVYVEGYSASVDNFARLVEELDISLDISPKAIITTSEDLIEPHRERIERVYGGKVFNRYGSREFTGAVAQECKQFEGMHVNNGLVWIEILDENGENVSEGERGELVITDLNNRVMPFIRYRIGDSAIKGPDKGVCGINFPIIKAIKGKANYFLVSKEGEKTPIETVASYLFQKYVSEVYNFQFIHPEPGKVHIKIVPTKEFRDEIIDEMKSYLHSVLGEFKVSIESVDQISPEDTGKTPFLVKFDDEK